jgi:hypothetical protein
MGIYKLKIGVNVAQKNEAIRELKKKFSFSCFDSYEVFKSKNDYFLKFETKDLNLLKKVKLIVENLGNENKLDKITSIKKCVKKPSVKQIAARNKFIKMVKEKSVKQTGISNKEIDAKKRAKLPGMRLSVNNRVYYESRANRSDKNPAKMLGIGSMFDYSIINDIDSLKKEYFKLAKKYHPDAGGSTAQFQALQNEYDKAFKKLLAGSKLTPDEKKIENDIDEIMRKIVDEIIGLETINIELIGKWLWVGSTELNGQFLTPIYNSLKSAGLSYIKKGNRPYMVYRGVQSSSRGKMTIDEIKNKYGVHKFEAGKNKRISGVSINKTRLTTLFKKLTLLLNKRSL